jgi:hypothetical protein
MRTITCTPVGLGPGLAHTPAKVGLGGLLLLGLDLYAPGDRVENSHSSPIFTGSDVWLPACLPACFLFQISGWNFLCLLHCSDISTTFPLLFPHALSSLYCILIYTATISGCTYHRLLVSSNAAFTFHTSQPNLLCRTHKQCANSYNLPASSHSRTSPIL